MNFLKSVLLAFALLATSSPSFADSVRAVAYCESPKAEIKFTWMWDGRKLTAQRVWWEKGRRGYHYNTEVLDVVRAFYDDGTMPPNPLQALLAAVQASNGTPGQGPALTVALWDGGPIFFNRGGTAFFYFGMGVLELNCKTLP